VRPFSAVAGFLALLLQAGCGGEDSSRDEARRSAGSAKKGITVVAALGDSITAGSPLWDPNPGIRRRLGLALDPGSQYEFWAQRRLERTRFRNCGVPGARTDQIAQRLHGCARGADVLIVQGGTNDIDQGRQASAAARNLQSMVREGKRLGLRVAIAEALPWNDGYPAAAPAIRRLNGLIAAIGRREEVPVYPWYRRLEDPRAPGRMKRRFTADGAHPTVAGYRRLAEVVELP
jgi:lysophospholipase L1-like esterase